MEGNILTNSIAGNYGEEPFGKFWEMELMVQLNVSKILSNSIILIFSIQIS